MPCASHRQGTKDAPESHAKEARATGQNSAPAGTNHRLEGFPSLLSRSSAGQSRRLMRPLRSSSHAPPARQIRGRAKPFPKCRVVLPNMQAPAPANFSALRLPRILNVLPGTPDEYDSISRTQSTANSDLRHSGNAIRSFRNVFPTFRERRLRHYGNRPSTFRERRSNADSCDSRDSRMGLESLNSLTSLETL